MNKVMHILCGSLVGVTVISGLILSSVKASADNTDVVDNIAITVPESCTLSGDGMNSHTATINPGTYNSSIGLTTITAFCNDNEGFAIYAIGYTNEEDGNNVLTSSALGSSADISTSTATSGATSAWAMKLAVPQSPTPTYPMTIQSDTEGSFSSFHTVPDDYTLVAKRTSSTDVGTNAEGSSLTTTYQTYISQTQPAGTYLGKVKYTMVHPHDVIAPEKHLPPVITAANKISYNPDVAGVIDSMDDQTLSSSDTSATLWPSNFQRPGYGFAGWNTRSDYSGDSYGPDETITFEAGQYSQEDGGLSLYAIWIKSQGNLQDFTAGQCSNMAIDQVTALTDVRDNNTYAVAKLDDGKCWMVENLRIANEHEGSNSVLETVLSSANTHNPVLPLNNSDGNISNHLSAPVDPQQTAWCKANSTACINQSMLSVNNTIGASIAVDSMITPTDANVYSYGNYYNWYSATAGNGTYSISTGDVAGDVCPNHWHLPTGTDDGEFLTLIHARAKDNTGPASSEALRRYPANFIYSGFVNESSIVGRGSHGRYWSSTLFSNSYALNLIFQDGYTMMRDWNGSNKYFGSAVRCLFSD